MSDRPLLLFPGKATVSRSKKGGGQPSYHFPSHEKQGQRLSLKFTQLQNALNQRNLELQQTSSNIEPEQVLVIETVGSVENFINAVRKVQGLEWLGEINLEEILPDEDFYEIDSINNPLAGRLYLVMSNLRAMDEILSMWNRWQQDKNTQFARGLTKFRDVFSCLRDIRRWDIQDRLYETGALEKWKEDLKHDCYRYIRFEIELWFRHSEIKRREISDQINSLISDLQGQVARHCVISEIAYHAILAELPANAIQLIIDNPRISLIGCEGIMFFRPVGQINSGYTVLQEQLQTDPVLLDYPLPTGSPIVGIFDGLPVANHSLLANRIIIDDPDSWLSEYKINELIHGTIMASLVVHGDLSNNDRPLDTPIYIRPIMKPDSKDSYNNCRREMVPETSLVVDLLHTAVKRIFEGDGQEEAVAPTIKVINISVCDPNRHFDHFISPWARLLDWLSVKYNVLFIVSAGNHSASLTLDIPEGKRFKDLSTEEKREKVVKALYKDSRHRRILSPAESINSLTVGSAQIDNCSNFNANDSFDPLGVILPSPISPFGSGYRKSLKPDFIYPGGRQLYRESFISKNKLDPLLNLSPPGNKVAYPGVQVGELDRTVHCRGTSNSAALLTHSAVILYKTLTEILQAGVLKKKIENLDYKKYEVPLLKAMLGHGCSWGEMAATIEHVFHEEVTDKKQLQKLISRWVGYGVPDINKVFQCTKERATIIGFGELFSDEAHLFELPLPPSLESKKEWRKVTITLAYNSPTISTNQKYRQASIWFELLDNIFVEDRSNAQWQEVRRGTLQHEIIEGQKAILFPEDGTLKIKVNCTNDAGKIEQPIPYGLIVSLEVKEGIDIQVYQEVKAKIAEMVKVFNLPAST